MDILTKIKILFYAQKHKVVLFCALSAINGVHAAPNIPASLLNQVKNMSVSEQQALARQYGFDLPEYPGDRQGQSPFLPDIEPVVQNRKADRTEDQIEGVETPGSVEEEDAPLTRFGANLFSEGNETYTPVDVGLAPAGYFLGPGDRIYLQVLGKDPIDAEIVVGREGNIVIPRIGSIPLLGLSFEEAKNIIQDRIRQSMLGSEAIVSLQGLRQVNIFMAGEVKLPGSLNVSSLTRLSQALFISGGISEIGSYRDIQVRRGGKILISFDLYDLLLKGDRSNDISLKHGDVVFVPVTDSLATIQGEVRRPAIYDVVPGDTVESLISYAGGVLPTGFVRQTTLQRFDSSLGTRRVLSAGSVAGLKLELVGGDEVTVPSGGIRIANTVELQGAVVRPGEYEAAEGSKVSDFISNAERDLLQTADMDVGLVVRRLSARLDIEVIPFDLVEAITNAESKSNLLVQPFDQIIVLPVPVEDDEVETEIVDPGSNFLIKPDEGEQFYVNESTTPETDRPFLPEELRRGVNSSFSANRGDQTDEEPTRESLLAPIMAKLRDQSGAGIAEPIVTIKGAVREPGQYPLLTGGSLEYLIELAGGLKDGAYLAEVEVRRMSVNAANGRATTDIIKTVLSDINPSISLRSRDVVRVNYIPGWNPDQNVTISGEVAFPGNYALRDNETLGSLLKRAGGLTDKSFAEAVRYTSEATRELQQANARKLVQRFEREMASRATLETSTSSITNGDGTNYAETLIDGMEGRLVVNVPRILAGDDSADVLLQDGDAIFVPRRVDSITVAGEVYEPGTFRYLPEGGIDRYIALAAGTTERAKVKSIYVIRPNGAVINLAAKRGGLLRFTGSKAAIIRPGSVVVVPTNYDYEKPIDRYKAITSVVFESVASIAAFLSISRN